MLYLPLKNALRNNVTQSRHTVVCRAAQEAGAQHP